MIVMVATEKKKIHNPKKDNRRKLPVNKKWEVYILSEAITQDAITNHAASGTGIGTFSAVNGCGNGGVKAERLPVPMAMRPQAYPYCTVSGPSAYRAARPF